MGHIFGLDHLEPTLNEHSLTKLKIIMWIALGRQRHFCSLFESLSTCYSACDIVFGHVTVADKFSMLTLYPDDSWCKSSDMVLGQVE